MAMVPSGMAMPLRTRGRVKWSRSPQLTVRVSCRVVIARSLEDAGGDFLFVDNARFLPDLAQGEVHRLCFVFARAEHEGILGAFYLALQHRFCVASQQMVSCLAVAAGAVRGIATCSNAPVRCGERGGVAGLRAEVARG